MEDGVTCFIDLRWLFIFVHCYGITWCMHVCFCLSVKSLFIGVSGHTGACVSRPQAGMGYYLGGAPLVTREWIILSDVP